MCRQKRMSWYFNTFKYLKLLNLYCIHCNELIRTISYNLCCVINNEGVQMKIQDQSFLFLIINTIFVLPQIRRLPIFPSTIYFFVFDMIDQVINKINYKTVNTAEKGSWFVRWSIQNFTTFFQLFLRVCAWPEVNYSGLRDLPTCGKWLLLFRSGCNNYQVVLVR